MEVIRPLWFEEQDPEPFASAKPPMGGGGEKTGKRAYAYIMVGTADAGPDAQTPAVKAHRSI